MREGCDARVIRLQHCSQRLALPLRQRLQKKSPAIRHNKLCAAPARGGADVHAAATHAAEKAARVNAQLLPQVPERAGCQN